MTTTSLTEESSLSSGQPLRSVTLIATVRWIRLISLLTQSLNYNKYTSASDVWSYGMVLFEIWSLGYKPFHDLANPIVSSGLLSFTAIIEWAPVISQVIALVTSKHCQAPPPGCPRPIYHLMVECW